MAFYGDKFSEIAFGVQPQIPQENEAPEPQLRGSQSKFPAVPQVHKAGRKKRANMPPPLQTLNLNMQASPSYVNTPTLHEQGLLTPQTPASNMFPSNFELASPPVFRYPEMRIYDTPEPRWEPPSLFFCDFLMVKLIALAFCHWTRTNERC